ncbi:MAG: hypothetical protein JJU36_10205 [Phycisphaeraceae bacterium]|nr:hypothetical protein [Phycisphaeraceae bacterium]
MRKYAVVACLLVGIVLVVRAPGCGWDGRHAAVEREKARRVADGWTFVEQIGSVTPDPKLIFAMSFESASSVTAVATGIPDPISKTYPQDTALYLLVTMGSDPNNTFTLVFSRPKP